MFLHGLQGWSGGAKVLGKLPVPGRPTNRDYSRARAYCACSRCGWGLFGHFSLIYQFSFLSPSLWETARYRLKYCLKGPFSPKQPTNQSMVCNPIILICQSTKRKEFCTALFSGNSESLSPKIQNGVFPSSDSLNWLLSILLGTILYCFSISS